MKFAKAASLWFLAASTPDASQVICSPPGDMSLTEVALTKELVACVPLLPVMIRKERPWLPGAVQTTKPFFSPKLYAHELSSEPLSWISSLFISKSEVLFWDQSRDSCDFCFLKTLVESVAFFKADSSSWLHTPFPFQFLLFVCYN